MTKELFKKALKLMLEEGEFPKLIAHAKNKTEKSRIAEDFDMISSLAERMDIEDFPIIPLFTNINSVETFRDIISYMLMLENKLLNTKGE